ncbi:MAG: SIS domain-containing protein [Marmoricola sp.]
MASRMRREIAEQAGAVAATVSAVLDAGPELQKLFAGRRHVLFAARGSSDNAAVYGRYLLETRARVPAGLVAPSVATHYRARLDLSDTLLVTISQSGHTGELVEVQRWAAGAGAATVAITNDPASPLAKGADRTLVLAAGPERAVPATKSYTAQLAAVAAMAAAMAPEAGLEAELADVPAEIDRLESAGDGVATAVELLADAGPVVVTGRGLVYGTALEVALKLEETCLRPVQSLSYADLRHGPIAAVGPGTTAILVAADDGPMVGPVVRLAGDLADRGARTLALGGGSALATACDHHLPGPRLPEAVGPLALVVPAQLVAEALARHLGLDPDAPRGLTKVTQTDQSAAPPGRA